MRPYATLCFELQEAQPRGAFHSAFGVPFSAVFSSSAAPAPPRRWPLPPPPRAAPADAGGALALTATKGRKASEAADGPGSSSTWRNTSEVD
jgi:hypothetical protein